MHWFFRLTSKRQEYVLYYGFSFLSFFNRLVVETHERNCCYHTGYPSVFALISYVVLLTISKSPWSIIPYFIVVHWLPYIYLYCYSLIWVERLNLWHCFVQKTGKKRNIFHIMIFNMNAPHTYITILSRVYCRYASCMSNNISSNQYLSCSVKFGKVISTCDQALIRVRARVSNEW